MNDERYVALKVLMMPRDANFGVTLDVPVWSIFGGVILSYIDQAGAIGARRAVQQLGGPLPDVVTVAVNRVEFKQPVLVGDVVRFLTHVVRLGRTSITMHIQVEAERGSEVLQVTEAEVVYVGVDRVHRRPVPLVPQQTA